MKGTIQIHRFTARGLEANPLGDPMTRRVPVYLPPGYAPDRPQRYPVAYFLHGFMGSGVQWLNPAPLSRNVPERLDWLIDHGNVPPVIGVFPDGMSALGGGQWMNSEGHGRYRDLVARDLVAWVDQTFSTLPTGRSRVLLGKSSGGFGTLSIARYHPDTFAHLGVHAGDAGFEYCYLPDLPRAASALIAAGGIEPWYQAFKERALNQRMRDADHLVINALAMAAAYSPKPGAPLNLEFPMDLANGRLNVTIWNRWLVQDPARMVVKNLEQFRGLKSIFIDCGTRDEYNLRWGARMISEDLTKAKIEHLHEEFDDGHSGTNYRFERSLSYLLPRVDTL